MSEPARLGVAVPALNAADTLAATLEAIGQARRHFDLDIVVVDGGSRDDTRAVAAAHGARVIAAPPGRGGQLAAGAAEATGDWLLFLHADTVLGEGWAAAAAAFVQTNETAQRAGYFRLTFDDTAAAARRLERIVAWRARAFGLPYGDQGLLISRAFYDSLGGYRSLALMEDVDLARRIGRRRLAALPAIARTSAQRYRRDGYARRSARNLVCLTLYFLGVPPRLIRKVYG